MLTKVAESRFGRFIVARAITPAITIMGGMRRSPRNVKKLKIFIYQTVKVSSGGLGKQSKSVFWRSPFRHSKDASGPQGYPGTCTVTVRTNRAGPNARRKSTRRNAQRSVVLAHGTRSRPATSTARPNGYHVPMGGCPRDAAHPVNLNRKRDLETKELRKPMGLVDDPARVSLAGKYWNHRREPKVSGRLRPSLRASAPPTVRFVVGADRNWFRAAVGEKLKHETPCSGEPSRGRQAYPASRTVVPRRARRRATRRAPVRVRSSSMG